MNLEFVSRQHLVAALMAGFSPVPGYEYRKGEYTFLLNRDGEERSLELATVLASIICPPPPSMAQRRPSWREINKEVRADVLTRLKRGDSHRSIELAVGIARSTISKIRKAHGLGKPPHSSFRQRGKVQYAGAE